MGKFNRSKAEQIVNEVITNHITLYGNLVYTPSGYLPYENGKRVNGNRDYPTFKNIICDELRKVFDPTKSYYDFINVYMNSVIRKSGIVNGICNFDSNGTPTYIEPKDIKNITIEVISDEDKLNSFIETI